MCSRASSTPPSATDASLATSLGARNLPPKQSQKPRRYLRDGEVVRLTEATNNDIHQTLILLLSYCGFRWSEATGMHVSDIVFPRHRIQVQRAAVEVEGKIVLGTPKNWERRLVPFPAFLEDPLKQFCRGKRADDLVFTYLQGKHLLCRASIYAGRRPSSA